MKTKLFLKLGLVGGLFFLFPIVIKAATLDSLPIGTAIQITGQGGAVYKFIKMIPKDDDGRTMAHSDGMGGSYWMLADNYCTLANRPSSCSDTNQVWNPTSDGIRYNNWTTMASVQDGIYQRVLSPMLNDLPPAIGNFAKDVAILTKDYPMYSIAFTGGTNTTSRGTCYLTAGSTSTGTANITNCTWTDKISLPSYTDWQDGLRAQNYFPGIGSSAHAYSMTRFGVPWNNSGQFNSNFSTLPMFRSPLAGNTERVWLGDGRTDEALGSVAAWYANASYMASPTLWLSSGINITCGEGTYKVPYMISRSDCQVAPNVKLATPTASWNNSNGTLSITGLANHQAVGQSILIWAAACNTQGQCKQKTTTVISNGGDQAYSLIWHQNELPAGTYAGTIWVGAHLVASPSDLDNDFIQSNSLNFTIAPRIIDLTVVKDRPFNLILGHNSNLTSMTNQGVTVSLDQTTNTVSVSGTLATDTQIPFGSAILDFKTLDIPQSVIINASLN